MADDSNGPLKLSDEGENADRDDSIDKLINAASGTAATLTNIVTCLKVLSLENSVDKSHASAIDHADDQDPAIANGANPADSVGGFGASRVKASVHGAKDPATKITANRPASATNSEASFVTAASRQTEQPVISPASSSIDVHDVSKSGQPSSESTQVPNAAQELEAYRSASSDCINDVAIFLRVEWRAARSDDRKRLLHLLAKMTSVAYYAIGMSWGANGEATNDLLKEIGSWEGLPGRHENENKLDPSSATSSASYILRMTGWLSEFWPGTEGSEQVRVALRSYARLIVISHSFLDMAWDDGGQTEELLSAIVTWKSKVEKRTSEHDAAQLKRDEARNTAIVSDEKVRAAAAEMAEETRKAAAAKEEEERNAEAAKKLAENNAAVLAAEEKEKKIKRKKAEKRKRYKNNRSQAMCRSPSNKRGTPNAGQGLSRRLKVTRTLLSQSTGLRWE
ncbi:hypothetical protein TI39_contig4153g00008 [Zymoseptoria brevis]|uniref:Uncharacterized protein n=1 Tax=Zymoseptoria brevis TaxID=1047168 RepID=A0A0F4GFE4_9PEZI|nr:hypothetical protein TI39_contig4153g00008 [Zymoseptoria brevis]